MPDSPVSLRRRLHDVGACLLLCAALATSACAQPAKRATEPPDVVIYGERDDVMAYADEIAQRQQLDPAWVRQTLAQSRYVPSVARFIMPPPAGTETYWRPSTL